MIRTALTLCALLLALTACSDPDYDGEQESNGATSNATSSNSTSSTSDLRYLSTTTPLWYDSSESRSEDAKR